jgi:hypothetical protein
MGEGSDFNSSPIAVMVDQARERLVDFGMRALASAAAARRSMPRRRRNLTARSARSADP